MILTIPCDCDTRAWEERPGLIVIDISDSLAPTVTAPQSPPLPTHRIDPARAAGLALALTHSQDQLRTEGSPTETPPFSLDGLTETLGRPIAEALGQGLLEPASAAPTDPPPVLLMPADDQPPVLPDNMRIVSVTGRPDPSSPAEPPLAESCLAASALEFLLTPSSEPFGTAFGRLTRQLYGEFDQPDPNARLALIELYLSNGFGAEARALIDNDSGPVVGREPLLGMSDLLENRNSNSRMRLAQMIGCSGPASLLAALAGASDADIRLAASSIALTFTELNAPLRAILGPPLANRLIEANAVDAARVVIGATRRSQWANPSDLDVLDAQLDWVRGLPGDAVARLDYLAGSDVASLQTRLDLALAMGGTVQPSLLAQAESLASAHRNNAAGPDLMDAVARLHARNGAFQSSFETLDRLRSWLPPESAALGQTGTLRDALWRAVGDGADDLALMHSVLNRQDWQDPGLRIATRQTLARRLIDLGLARQAIALLPEGDDTSTRELLAQAYLLLNQPDQALALLAGTESVAGRRLHAQALAARGDTRRAAREFEALDSPAEARSAAILAQDWDSLQRLDGGSESGVDSELDAMGLVMSRRPGYLNAVQPDPSETAAPGSGEPPQPFVERTARADASMPVARQPMPEIGPTGRVQPDAEGSAAVLQGASLPPVAQVTGTASLDPPPTAPIALATDQPPGDSTAIGTRPRAPDPLATRLPASDPYDFDRLGLITRSATLLGESERLRDTLAPLLRPSTSSEP
ncbi:MAG: hypothetical protein KDK01_04060 [Rhodobacteraceae bacterium]|nr:hypothetical protein [Paracoccaceae bacterium]